MKIGIVSEYYQPEPTIYSVQLGQYLSKKGHEVRVLTGIPNYPSGKLYPGFGKTWFWRKVIDGVDVKRVLLFPSHSGNPISRIFTYLSFSLSSLVATRFMSSMDVIYVYGTPITAAFAPYVWRRHVPYVVHVQDLWPESVTESGMLKGRLILEWVEKILRKWTSRIYSAASAVIGISPSMGKELVCRGAKVESVFTVFNWGQEAHSSSGYRKIEHNGFSLLYAGNIGQMQDLSTVIRALKLVSDLPGIRLDIIGNGTELLKVQNLVTELKLLNVFFHGRIPRDDIGSHYTTCDFHLVPLKDLPIFRMTIPSKFQTGLAKGIPVITSVQGDTARLVNTYNLGFVVPNQDEDSWANVISRAYRTSVNERMEMSIAALSLYDSQMSREKSLSALESIVTNSANHDELGS